MMRGFLTLLILLSTTASVPAQPLGRYATQLLQRMATQTGIATLLDTLHTDGIYPNFTTYEGLPVTVILRGNRVEHIGFSVFPLVQRKILPSPVYNFIERYTLEMRLPQERPISVERRLELDHVVFTEGSLSLLPSIYGDTTIFFSMGNRDERSYELVWSRGEERLCRVTFPSNYELLHGSRLIENENQMRGEIEHFADTMPQRKTYPMERTQKVDSTGYYVLDLGYNRVPQIANKRYLCIRHDSIAGRDSLVVLYNQHFPVETVANLFATLDVANDYLVEVKLTKYNFQEDRFIVPLCQLVGFCLNEGCKPYFGLLDYDESSGRLDAVVMMRNHEQAYEHLLRIKMDTTTLSQMRGNISVKLMGYIMTHNVKRM